MKLMKDMSQGELIELIAAVFFRVYGFIYSMDAFYDFYHIEAERSFYQTALGSLTPLGHHMVQLYIMDTLFHALIAVVMFLLAAPLARLVCRGLAKILELPPQGGPV